MNEQSPKDYTDPPIPVITSVFNKLNDKAGALLNEDLFSRNLPRLLKLAHLLLLISAAVGLLIGIIATIKFEIVSYLYYGIAWVIVLPLIHFIADQFLRTNPNLLDSTPSQLSSQSFLNTITFAAFVGALAYAGLKIFDAIENKQYIMLAWALISVIVGWSIAIVARNPGSINVSLEKETSAGTEAIGVMSFMVKTLYRIVPVLFSIGVIYYAIMLISSLFNLMFFAKNAALMSFIMEYGERLGYVVLAPVFAYFAFIGAYLTIDVLKAILNIPKKLDKK